MTAADSIVTESLNNRVLTITINRPEAKNAITVELNTLLYEVVRRAATNDEVGAIVLTGAGDSFCAGGDVKKMSSPNAEPASASSTAERLIAGAETTLLLHQMAKPTIAMIRGACAGGGLSLAMGCDLRYADETAKITFAYTTIGFSGDFAGGYMAEKLLGTARAREFCLLCPVIGTAEALALGLLNQQFPKADLHTEVYRRAERLANGPTAALGRIKANLNYVHEASARDYIHFEADNFMACRDSDEHREAIRAFVEKRAPKFHR